MKDKNHIEKAFHSNVEICRRMYASQTNEFSYFTNPELKKIQQTFTQNPYYTYAFYRDFRTGKIHAFPPALNDYLDVDVFDIFYSADSLKCIALLTVCNRSGALIGKNYPSYDGFAFVGIRESKDSQFKIYKHRLLATKGSSNKNGTIERLNNAYFGYVERADGYHYTVDNPKFFETAIDFERIDSLDVYECQTHWKHYMDKSWRVKTIVYSNQDSTINKYLY